jgi:glycerol kinase
MEAMQADTGIALSTLRVDGGLAANNFVCRMIADQLACAVERPANTETTAWGAAALAGLEAGLFKDQESLANLWRSNARFEHNFATNRDPSYAQWKDAVRRIMT